MIPTENLTDAELRGQIHKLIIEEFGVSALLRYIQTTSGGTGNWERERRELLSGVGMDEMLKDLHRLKSGREGARIGDKSST